MNAFTVRPILENELREAYNLTKRAYHEALSSDEKWLKRSRSFLVDRRFVATEHDQLLGVTGSFETQLTVPGNSSIQTAAVVSVAVRADHTRRGVLTALIREQFHDCLRRGDIAAYLHASEATIYGRFGFGIAAREQRVRVSSPRSHFREGSPTSGRVRILDPQAVSEQIPLLYQEFHLTRPGMITRPELWWDQHDDQFFELSSGSIAVVHTGINGDDGYVIYRVAEDKPEQNNALEIEDLHAANPQALAGLWRYLLSVDLISEVHALDRPVDEPLPLLLTDPNAYEVRNQRDHTWLRLLDVFAALKARSYRNGEPVVLEIVDALLPNNSGNYRISSDGVEKTTDPPEVRLTVEALGMVYLGAWQWRILAESGRIEVLEASAIQRADDLFRTNIQPWCGTQF